MPFKIILDNREHGIAEILKTRSIPFPEPKPQLALGDILITNSDDSGLIHADETKKSANKLLAPSKTSKNESDEKIENSDTKITLVIERKSFTDLKASM